MLYLLRKRSFAALTWTQFLGAFNDNAWKLLVTLLAIRAAAAGMGHSGAAYEAFRTGLEAAWGVESVDIGSGGSIPFVAAFSQLYPEATILLTGAGDHLSGPHGPNESVDLDELRLAVLAEAVALGELGT